MLDTVSRSRPERHEPMPSYGGRPALKPSVYGWLVGLYIYVGGLAGGTQILSSLIDLAGVPGAASLVATGRLFAAAAAIGGGILLIVELHTPQRFYNMLRIFRPTSTMSIGTYVLMSFGFLSSLAALAHLLGWPILALVLGLVACVPALLMTCYPAAFLSATSTPLWSAAPQLLAVRFAASSMATGAAVLCLLAVWPFGLRILSGWLAVVLGGAVLIELAASLLARRVYASEGVDGALSGRHAVLDRIGAQLVGNIAPMALVLGAGLVPTLASPLLVPAALCVLAGGLVMRGSVLLAGNASARRPEDYFRLASGRDLIAEGGRR